MVSPLVFTIIAAIIVILFGTMFILYFIIGKTTKAIDKTLAELEAPNEYKNGDELRAEVQQYESEWVLTLYLNGQIFTQYNEMHHDHEQDKVISKAMSEYILQVMKGIQEYPEKYRQAVNERKKESIIDQFNTLNENEKQKVLKEINNN